MMISISEISKLLNVRPSRILEKLDKLNIIVQYENGLMYINTSDVRILANEYMQSKRTSERTQMNAKELLTQLEQGNFKPLTMEKSNEVQHKKRTKTNKNISNKRNNANKTLLSPSHSFFGSVISTVQNVLVVCVQGLESLYFKFFALFVAIFVQMHHTAIWFFRSAPEGSSSWLAAYGYAIMLDLFILVVTLEGRLSIAKTFAGLTFVSNLLYFQFWLDFGGTALDWTKAISCIIISATIAFIIYSYTEIFVKYRKEKLKAYSNSIE